MESQEIQMARTPEAGLPASPQAGLQEPGPSLPVTGLGLAAACGTPGSSHRQGSISVVTALPETQAGRLLREH